MATKPAAKKASPAKVPVGKSLNTARTAKAAAAPAEAGEDAPVKLVNQMKAKELVDHIVEATDQNRKDVKIIVEAALEVMARALDKGEVLNLPPLGRIRVANSKNDDAGTAMTLKLRRGIEKPKVKKAGKQALAEAGEAS